MLLFYVLIGVFKIQVTFGSERIFTCCYEQGGLEKNGNCIQGEYEFERDVFNQNWNVPNALKDGEINGNLQFTLEVRPPWCSCREMKIISVDLRKERNNPEWKLDGNLLPPKFLADGTLKLQNEIYDSHKYCLNTAELGSKYYQLGVENIYRVEMVVCMESCMGTLKLPEVKGSPLMQNSGDLDLSRTSSCDSFQSGDTNESICTEWTPFYYNHQHLLVVMSGGNVTFGVEDDSYPWLSLPSNTYCKATQHSPQTEGIFLKFCIPQIKKLFYGYQELYAILAGVSCLFLLLNLGIYFGLRDSLSISGWTEFLYSLSLFSYCALSIGGLLFVPEDSHVRPGCAAISIILQFLELTCNTTLVCLSFDIFWTFCKYDSWSYTDDPKVTKLRLSLYIIFSLGLPLTVVSYGIVKSHLHWEMDSYASFGHPYYGLFHCTSPNWFLSSIVSFGLQSGNLLMAMMGAYVLINKKKPMEIPSTNYDQDELQVTSEHAALHPDRQDIFSKLFVFVLVFWILGFMQFFFGGEIFVKKWHLVAFHVANYSQGIFAFFVLICNTKTLDGIAKRRWNLKVLFCHACCTSSKGVGTAEEIPEESLPLSPLMQKMKSGSIRRSTVRGNQFY